MGLRFANGKMPLYFKVRWACAGSKGKLQNENIKKAAPNPRAAYFTAGDQNRTDVTSLEGLCSTIELHPQDVFLISKSLFRVNHFLNIIYF